MIVLDDVRSVVLLACETKDRSDDEQRALLRVAVRADNAMNARVVTNERDGDAWRLTDIVLGTDSDMERSLPKSLRTAIEKTWRRADQWDAEREQVA